MLNPVDQAWMYIYYVEKSRYKRQQLQFLTKYTLSKDGGLLKIKTISLQAFNTHTSWKKCENGTKLHKIRLLSINKQTYGKILSSKMRLTDR